MSRQGKRASKSTLVLLACSVATALALSPAAEGRGAADLTLDVSYALSGDISVTLPGGAPVGTTSGAPTMIPAGFYTLVFSGPGGCAQSPDFQLQGPGVNIVNDLDNGQETSTSAVADFMPSSTYTWSSFADPSDIYTFVTSSEVVGTAPLPQPSPGSTLVGSSVSETSSAGGVVGTAVPSSRRVLTGSVGSRGTIALSYRGAPVTRLSAGRYTITVADASTASGFMLEKDGRLMTVVTTGRFVGTRSISVDLTSGDWAFTSGVGKKTHALHVN